MEEMVFGAKLLGYGGGKQPGLKIEAKRLGGLKRLGGETSCYLSRDLHLVHLSSYTHKMAM